MPTRGAGENSPDPPGRSNCRALAKFFPRSCREAHLALQIQKAVRGREQVTLFEQLGAYQLLGTARDTSAMERFVHEWLGALMDYDTIHGTQLLKYRLKRIREVSGHDLGLPDTQFNLQLATRAWRTLRALRDS